MFGPFWRNIPDGFWISLFHWVVGYRVMPSIV